MLWFTDVCFLNNSWYFITKLWMYHLINQGRLSTLKQSNAPIQKWVLKKLNENYKLFFCCHVDLEIIQIKSLQTKTRKKSLANISIVSLMHIYENAAQTLTLLYLLVLVVAGWLLVGILLYVTSGRALWSVGARYWTVLLAHITTTGTSLRWHKPAGQSGRQNIEKEH